MSTHECAENSGFTASDHTVESPTERKSIDVHTILFSPEVKLPV